MAQIMLKSLYIDNFKSFKKSKFKFGKLNCLIAPNNAGKSNLIFVLNFINDALYNGLFAAISRLDLKNIRNYHYKENLIEIEAEYEINNEVLVGTTLIKYENKLSVVFKIDLETKIYNFDVDIKGKLKYIDVEKFDLKNNLGYFDLKVYNNFIEYNLSNYDKYLNSLNKKRFSNFELQYSQNSHNCIITANNNIKNIVKKLYSLVFAEEKLVSTFDFKNIFNNFQLFNYFYFDINQIKKPELTGNNFLLYNGKNLIEVLDFLNKNNNKVFENISISLIGEIEGIRGLEMDNSLFFPSLKLKEEIGADEYNIDIWNASDGTIHFIAIMTAILSNENSIGIMIEEPERHLHMKVLSYILNSMRDCEAQIFFTTHSGELLKILKQDEIIFLYRDELNGDTKGLSASKIKKLDKLFKKYKYEITEIIKDGVLGYLGDYDG